MARSLAGAEVVVHVLDGPRSPARFSRAVTNFVDVGVEQPQARMLDWLRSGPVPAVVLPGSDEGVELIARNRGQLEQLGYLPVEGDDQALLKMLDKAQTYELARRHGIAVPRIVHLRTAEEVEAAVAELEFPCVLKPAQSHLFARKVAPVKVQFVNSAAELRRELDTLRALDVEAFVTEVIVGASDEFVSYYGYLDHDGSSLVSFTKRKLRQNPPGFGIGTYHETTDDAAVSEVGLRFLQAAGIRGLGNVEFKRDAEDGELKLIDCNPRCTLSNELARRSGV
ncbi:MAG: hypothetical protein M3025_04670, partial [Actinomycetota bacterium]|nr:hypothetical protein [Actinomycetota bacterium]